MPVGGAASWRYLTGKYCCLTSYTTMYPSCPVVMSRAPDELKTALHCMHMWQVSSNTSIAEQLTAAAGRQAQRNPF